MNAKIALETIDTNYKQYVITVYILIELKENWKKNTWVFPPALYWTHDRAREPLVGKQLKNEPNMLHVP
jgi:hypothetical protein